MAINDQKAYLGFLDTELQLRQISDCLDTTPPNSATIFKGREVHNVVEDDQWPFFQNGDYYINLF